MNTRTGIRLAADLDALGREEIDSLRQHNLTRMLDVARRTPALLGRLPELKAVQHVEDLPRLPVLTAAALADDCPPRSDEFLLDGGRPGMVLRSSGTAGKVKMMYHSWEFNEQISALGARGLRAGLVEQPRLVANCLFAAELNGAFLFAHEVTRLLSARVFPIGSTTGVEKTAQVLSEHAVDTLIAAPGFGTDLLTSAPSGELAALRTFLFIGESLGTARTKAIADALPELDVRSLGYSTTETGCIGYQCTHQTGTVHHVHDDTVIVEIVDGGTGRQLPEGEAGDVVVTPLSDTGMALFRYRIGDRGRLSSQPCPCGSRAQVLTLLGRSAQSLNVDSQTFSTDQVLGRLALLGISDPADFQLQVLWDVNRYRVRLLLSLDAPEEITHSAVAEAFSGAYEIHELVTGPRCREFTVERVDTADFERTERGKVPTLYQRPANA